MRIISLTLVLLAAGFMKAGAQTPKIFHYSHSGSPQSLRTSNGQNFGIIHKPEYNRADTSKKAALSPVQPTLSNARSADSGANNKKNPPVKPKIPAQPPVHKK